MALEKLAGRWNATKDGVSQGLILITATGELTFVGEPDDFKIAEKEGTPGFMLLSEEGEELCPLEHQLLDNDVQTLSLADEDGGMLVWTLMPTAESPKAKTVVRRNVTTALPRRFTKEIQAQDAATALAKAGEAAAPAGSQPDVQSVLACFQQWNQGSINRPELAALLSGLDASFTPAVVEEVLKAAGMGQETTIDVESLLKWIYGS